MLKLIPLLALLFGLPAHAQQYPKRPVRIVLFVPAGGGADLLARVMAQKPGEVVRRAQQEGPQTMTFHGKDAAVVVAAKDFASSKQRKGSLLDFFRNSPLVGIDVKTERSRDTGRRNTQRF